MGLMAVFLLFIGAIIKTFIEYKRRHKRSRERFQDVGTIDLEL